MKNLNNTLKLVVGGSIFFALSLGLAGCEKGCDKKNPPVVNDQNAAVPNEAANNEANTERGPGYYHDRLKADWATLKPQVHQHWNLLTEEDLVEVDGSFDKLSEKIQAKYTKSKEEADQTIKNFLDGKK